MKNYILSNHAQIMMNERNIKVEWLEKTLDFPDNTIIGNDNTTHYIKILAECDNRILRVVVDEFRMPSKVITLFFDRRLRRQYNEITS